MGVAMEWVGLSFRVGNLLDVALDLVPLPGTAAVTGWTRLYLGDELLGGTSLPGRGVFVVDSRPAEYRLVTAVSGWPGGSPAPVTVYGSWTFASEYHEECHPLALRCDDGSGDDQGTAHHALGADPGR